MEHFKEFEIDLGTTRTIDHAEELATELANFNTNGHKPLGFAEFTRLVSTGHLTRPPVESDPFIYRGDVELARSDDEIHASTGITGDAFKRLRRAFLFKKARETALTQIEHEKEILTHSRPLAQGRAPTHSDYVAYLATFHKNDLETFFRPWALPVSSRDLKAHAYIGACSGHGKSELIKVMLYGLLKKKQSVILFDPHGDIAEEVTHWKEFAENPERLIYFYPYLAGEDLTTVPVLNPLAPLYQSKLLDSAVENFIDTISAVVGSGDADISRRMKTLLKPCIYSLAEQKNADLFDLIAFVSESEKVKGAGKNQEKRPTPLADRAKKQLINNAGLMEILETFFDTNYDNSKSAIRDRLLTLLSSNALNRCLGGSSTIDLESALDSGKFIVFNLSAGMLGGDTSNAFGRFLIASIQNMAMRRQAQHKNERRPVFMFLDEADRFMSESIPKIYKETRKYGLYLTIAQQITGYGMGEEMKRSVLGSSKLTIAGASGGDRETAKDLEDITGIDRAEIKVLKKGNFYVKPNSETPARKFTVPTTLMDGKNAMSEADWERVKAYQLEHYYKPVNGQKRVSRTEPQQPSQSQDDTDAPVFI
jgi:Helicase HerA, central domain/TraM recognition site of TraD and TraG